MTHGDKISVLGYRECAVIYININIYANIIHVCIHIYMYVSDSQQHGFCSWLYRESAVIYISINIYAYNIHVYIYM